MTAYLIANVDVKDVDAYAPYRDRARPIVEKYGGRYIVRGGEVDVLEGVPQINRLVILEFPDRTAANAFYNSQEYQEIVPIRIGSTDSRLFIVEGFDG